MSNQPWVATLDGLAPAVALEIARAKLQESPAAAELQAREVLLVLPDDIRALCIIGAARRLLGDLPTSRQVLTAIVTQRADYTPAWVECAITLTALGETELAVGAWREAARAPAAPAFDWLRPVCGFVLAGDVAGAARARAEYFRTLSANFDLRAAADALRAGRARDAAIMVRAALRRAPDDAVALRIFAEASMRLGEPWRAAEAMERAIAAAPGQERVQYEYAGALAAAGQPHAALGQLAHCAALLATQGDVSVLAAACHIEAGQIDQAATLTTALTRLYPFYARLWAMHGEVVRLLGDDTAAEAAFRHAIALRPSMPGQAA